MKYAFPQKARWPTDRGVHPLTVILLLLLVLKCYDQSISGSGIMLMVVVLYVSGVKTPPVLEKKPSPRRVAYSSRSSYNSAGRKIKGRGAVVRRFSVHIICYTLR